MKKRTGKVSKWELIALALVSVGLFALLVNSARISRARDFETRYHAAQLCNKAFAAVRDERLRLGLTIDPINDPNQTGLIGSQYSIITVGRGDQSGAMSSTNPNFVAVVLSLLRRAGVRAGDVVAVGLNGSLPALNIELLAACQVLGANPIVVSAASSGMWGANDPQFTWLDIERLLSEKGIVPYRSKAATLGGEGDDGRGLSAAGRAWLDSSVARNHVRLLTPKNISDAVDLRMAVYRTEAASRPIKVFVNVGSAVADLGEAARPLPSGLVDRRAAGLPDPSVMRAMAEQGAILVNLADVNRLAYRYRFPVASVPLPTLARGRMFTEKRYPVNLALIFAVLIVALLFFIIEIDVDYYMRRLVRKNPAESQVAK